MLIFENKQDKIDINQEHISLIESIVEECLKDFSKKVKNEIAVSIIIVEDEEMRRINMQHRNIDRPTDVLSFPMFEIDPFGDDEPEIEVDFDTNCVMLGDIVISAEITCRQAEKYGHSFHREIGFLVSHGVYHMLGYDHETIEDEEMMTGMQEKVLISIGLAR